MKGVHKDEIWVEDPMVIKKNEVKEFFENRFKEESWNRPKLDGVGFQQISREANIMLTLKFKEKKVKNTI